MRLLVSVRSADEVWAAVAGGADIIDVKEPSRGALGAVDPEVAAAVAGRVPESTPLSVALGDPAGLGSVEATVRRLSVRRQAGDVILKLGFAGVSSEAVVAERLAAAIAAAPSEGSPELVAVAYADWARAGAPSPDDVARAASRAGVRGVLLDTSIKDGRDLFSSISQDDLSRWIRVARAAGLLVAVAGSLDADGIVRLLETPPDVVGVRGAACDGGRLGLVSAARVRTLRAVVDASNGRPGLDEPPAKRQTVGPLSAR
jgi:uncharacterized protein (UPF0264 family)